MLELLITCVEITCLFGYLYGAYLVVRHAADLESPEAAWNRYARTPTTARSCRNIVPTSDGPIGTPPAAHGRWWVAE
jgi:hypothetical protein